MNINNRAIRKAKSSICRYKICAIALDSSGRVMGYSRNSPRFSRKGGGTHAEMALMRQYGKNISTIILVRTNKNGNGMLPIHPCKACASKANDLGIKIVSTERI